MPAILVVLGRIILACGGLLILTWLFGGLAAQWRETERKTPRSRIPVEDYPWAIAGGLLVVVFLALGLTMIILAFTA